MVGVKPSGNTASAAGFLLPDGHGQPEVLARRAVAGRIGREAVEIQVVADFITAVGGKRASVEAIGPPVRLRLGVARCFGRIGGGPSRQAVVRAESHESAVGADRGIDQITVTVSQGADGVVLIGDLGRQIQEAAVTQRKALVGTEAGAVAIAGIGAPEFDAHVGAPGTGLENDVEHARDRVRAIDR